MREATMQLKGRARELARELKEKEHRADRKKEEIRQQQAKDRDDAARLLKEEEEKERQERAQKMKEWRKEMENDL